MTKIKKGADFGLDVLLHCVINGRGRRLWNEDINLKYLMILVPALVLAVGGYADSLTGVLRVFDARNCGGCHRETTARLAMGHFTLEGGERELMKSFAYRHYKLRERVESELGRKAFVYYPLLGSPSIEPATKDPLAGPRGYWASAQSFMSSITRDGESLSKQDENAILKWFADGAPLPRDVLDETFEEIRTSIRGYDKSSPSGEKTKAARP